MKKRLKNYREIIICITFCVGLSSFAQDESLESIFKVDYDTPLTLDLEADEALGDKDGIEVVKGKKKKKKRNVFFGIKTRKGFTRTQKGGNTLWEQFHVLKKYEGPPEYTRDFYWYDAKKKVIKNSIRVNEKYASVLHGPYTKKLGDQVIEAGWFYKGMKHKRWVRFNRHDILQEKSYWWKGWPQESRLAYHDFQKTKLKEVIPVHFGEKNGEYWSFHEDGSIAVRGTFQFGHRVGKWQEFYDGRRLKREVIYPDDPFNFGFNPYISKEWDKGGKLIYDRKKMLSSRK
ncbi:MAG: hypothetical protein AAF616_03150 [Bacteroidota bacterium]